MSGDPISTRVTENPEVRSGQPIIRGTRITVGDILDWLRGGATESAILADYPELTAEDIKAAQQFAFRREAHLQSLAVAASTGETIDQTFIDAISEKLSGD